MKYTFLLLAALAFQSGAVTVNAKNSISQHSSSAVQVDSLDLIIESLMKKRQVPGLSLAVIQDGKIVKAKGYGFIDKTGKIPVTESTLFQAGSISKSVSAVGALFLVEKGKLSLDEDVNSKLKTWKVPENEFLKDKKVTLRGLLSHTTGLTVSGFPGYAAAGPIPSVVQILDGTTPANTGPVRVDFVPGSQWRYSGGGYTVMQQMIIDVTGKSFPEFMQETILTPTNMRVSTFKQPLPADKAKLTATAHTSDRTMVEGRWHIYPEMAAAGLWTTPSDLARFAISIQNGLAGKAGSVLSQAMIRQMLTDQKNNDGLGVFVEGKGNALRFGHGGRDEGFDALLTAGAETGQGVVIMINANDNSRLVGQVLNAVAAQYHWEGFPVSRPIPRVAANVKHAQVAAFEGRYELDNNRMIAFLFENNRLYSLTDNLPDEEFVPLSPTQFASTDRDAIVTFTPDAKGQVTDFMWKTGNEERKVPRIGPLFTSPKTTSDPNPARTKQIEAALNAMGKGGKALEEAPGIADGTRRAFTQGTRDLHGMTAIQLVHTENVQGRGIQRHGGDVNEIVTYQLSGNKPGRFVLVHLTAAGLVTDCDVVSK
ncbi:serine hydrolase domain-containing protein [Dyadobacter crusticola]|uniref:serine hydrolase domain-containing protein n=1 Tax=Dyadobacter crusticola TaxID=292407 RepID=UPI000691995C|nr:serine hydrolase domain-containing protein [Dyadobacter crusticola]